MNKTKISYWEDSDMLTVNAVAYKNRVRLMDNNTIFTIELKDGKLYVDGGLCPLQIEPISKSELLITKK